MKNCRAVGPNVYLLTGTQPCRLGYVNCRTFGPDAQALSRTPIWNTCGRLNLETETIISGPKAYPFS